MTAFQTTAMHSVTTVQPLAEPRYRTAKIEIDAAELRLLLQRAVNTMDPSHWPKWVESVMGGTLQVGADGKQFLDEGILPSDQCTFQFRRRIEDQPSA